MKNFNALITDFDFKKIIMIMAKLDWQWNFHETRTSSVPTIDDLKSMAYALKYVVDKSLETQDFTYVRSGGLCLHGKVVNNQIDYRLVFELESQG